MSLGHAFKVLPASSRRISPLCAVSDKLNRRAATEARTGIGSGVGGKNRLKVSPFLSWKEEPFPAPPYRPKGLAWQGFPRRL